ncbi:MAG TPA: hypothetical protein VFH92_01315 [Phenylobacterium sp.]|nr:hypothetical protein [Phenylobacterium sp.]
MAAAPKRPTPASRKKVTPENLANLGAERLAELLATFAETRPELKRRLRMELAAEEGADHLVVEIDKRLATLGTSRSKVSWRKRASFVGDLDTLRALVAERLAALDGRLALDRLWLFMDLARRLGLRVKDRDGAMGAVFMRGAGDIGALLADRRDPGALEPLVEAIARNPGGWLQWLPPVLGQLPAADVESLLARMLLRGGAGPEWPGVVRLLADAAGDVDAYRETFSSEALRNPAIAALIARRLLAVRRTEEAGQLLAAARVETRAGRAWLGSEPGPDFEWETAWIDYLDQAGQGDEAQAARWASFERTLSIDRARDFVRRLTGFDDVEAEARAQAYAAAAPDFDRGLRFLMGWPALPEAAAMIAARRGEIRLSAEEAELWAGRLRARFPAAANTLLRKAAADAFKRRDFATCDRLTHEADTIAFD